MNVGDWVKERVGFSDSRESIEETDRMVERVSWFKPVDYEILLFYDNHDIWATAKVISRNIDYNRQYVSKRLVAMEKADLLESDNGMYRPSEFGRKYLSGDVAAEQMDEKEP